MKIMNKINTNLLWVCHHLDKLNKDILSKFKFTERVIDVSVLYYFHGGITSTNKLTSISDNQKYDLMDILDLWNNGFSYHNFPVLSYLHYGNGKQEIVYYNTSCKEKRIAIIESNMSLFPEELLKKIINLRVKTVSEQQCVNNLKKIKHLLYRL